MRAAGRRAAARRRASSSSARASRPGFFTQLNARADLAGRACSTSSWTRPGGVRARRWARSPATGSPEAARRSYDAAQRRPEGAARDPLPRARGPQPAAARRADRQPRHRLLRGAGDGARRLRGHGRRGLARPRVPARAGPLPAWCRTTARALAARRATPRWRRSAPPEPSRSASRARSAAWCSSASPGRPPR